MDFPLILHWGLMKFQYLEPLRAAGSRSASPGERQRPVLTAPRWERGVANEHHVVFSWGEMDDIIGMDFFFGWLGDLKWWLEQWKKNLVV